MKFLYPQFLFALLAISIPIIIHLFNFRRFKKLYFSNVRFLKEIKQETQSKSRLKHLLVLFSRILAISALVLAFAQPFIPVEDRKVIAGSKAISIYVDNSFSMEAVHQNGRLIDEAVKKATRIINAYKSTDQFQILTNDFEARHQRLMSKEDALAMLDEIKPSATVKSIKDIFTRQADLLKGANQSARLRYIISDFQKSSFSIAEIKSDSAISTFFIPLPAQQKDNLSIDSCWFKTPVHQLSQVEEIIVKIRNYSENQLENIPLKLYIDKEQKALSSFSIEPNSTVEVPLTFKNNKTGIQQVRIEVASYPVVFDDEFYISFETLERINVAAINEEKENPYLNSLFADSLFKFVNQPAKLIDYTQLFDNQLIILNSLKVISSGLGNELKKFVENGGSLLLFPDTANAEGYNSFLTMIGSGGFDKLDTVDTKVDALNFEQLIYRNVFDPEKRKEKNTDWPVVRNHYPIKKTTRSSSEYLMKLKNGELFMNLLSFGKGKIYLCSVPLNDRFSNFHKHAIFVPTLFNIALYSNHPPRLFYTIGKNEVIELTHGTISGDNTFHIHQQENKFDVIPEHRIVNSKIDIYVHDQVKTAGNYLIALADQTVAGVSFNYDRKESDLSCYSEEELLTQVKDLGLSGFSVLHANDTSFEDALKDIDLGKRLWRLFLILALVFFGVEVLLLKFWK